MTCFSHHTNKVKGGTTKFIYWMWSKSTMKGPERRHAVFIFNSQINIIFSLLTLNMYISVGHRIKSTKHLVCMISNKAVSLRHVHVT